MRSSRNSNILYLLLLLLRKALDNFYQIELPKDADWESVLGLASEQGVQGICLEEIEQLPVGTIPQPILLQWIGLSEMQRQQYEQTWKVACTLDKLWAAEGPGYCSEGTFYREILSCAIASLQL